MDRRLGKVSWGPGNPRKRTSPDNWRQPIKWNKKAELGIPFGHRPKPRVFCSSLADWLDDEVPIEWLADLLDLIRRTPCLDWLLLTKRPHLWDERIGKVVGLSCITGCDSDSPHNWAGWLASRWLNGQPPENVWLGTTVEDQARADERIPLLLQIPARTRFLSCEPLLEPLDLVCMLTGDALHADKTGRWVDWIICGGESGRNARPMQAEWVRSLRDQCEYVHGGVPFFFKQWGEYAPNWFNDSTTGKKIDGSEWMDRVGGGRAGNVLDGCQHREFPESRYENDH